MANFSFDISSLEKVIGSLGKVLPDAGREAVREGCRQAGRYIKLQVKTEVPILKSKDKWLEWPAHCYAGGVKTGRVRSKTVSGQPLSYVAGELRDSIYFTFSPKNSSIPQGRMTYLVGYPHSHGGGKIVKGWYGHFINQGHALLNYPVNLKDTPRGKAKAKRLGITEGIYPGKMGARVTWVPGKNFIGEGYSKAKERADVLLKEHAEKKLKQMLKQQGF